MERSSEKLNVLMVGNNPLEMTKVFDCLSKIPGIVAITEIAFDVKSALMLMSRFKPNFILIDDNVGRFELAGAIQTFSHSRKSKNVPVTIIKNSNYKEAFSGDAMSYVLKDSLSAESLYRALKSSLVSSKTQNNLKKVYRKRKGQLKRLLP